MPTIRRTFKIDGVATDMTSVKLSDPTGTYGVKRDDTDAVVVVDGTAMTKVATGIYEHTFTAPAAGLTYTYYLELVYGGETYWQQDTFSDVAANGYCTLAEAMSEIEETLSADAQTKLTRIINDVKGLIDDYCDRKFDTVTEARYFDGVKTILYLGDLISASEVALDDDGDGTFGDVLAATDYNLYPLNGYPKTGLELNPYGNYTELADGLSKAIKITGTWGYYSSVPNSVRRAAIMWATIIWRMSKAGYTNTLGSTEIGTVTIDRDPPAQVKKILDKYKKVVYF